MIYWFDDPRGREKSLTGGKGANLVHLTLNEVPVPPGFVVGAESYTALVAVNGLAPLIAKETSTLSTKNNVLLKRRGQRLRDLITKAKMPPEMADAIKEAYKRLGEGPVAVRSSATAEDLGEASFAGQQSTYLNVEGSDNVIKAVQACMASLWEDRAIYYRHQQGFDHLTVSLAVVVQKMIASEKSGVMFTVEPVTSDPTKIKIEAVYGLGEGIVSGEITPDAYLINKGDLEVVDVQTFDQSRMISRVEQSEHEHGNTGWADVPVASVKHQKLSAAEIEELAGIGRHIEDIYQGPQDIEWAYEGGKFYVTQARPVTTIREGGQSQSTTRETANVLLKGSPASTGAGHGKVQVIRRKEELYTFKAGNVLVMEMTTPDCVPQMKMASAIVTERGGSTCHAAIVSRELGIPCAVGVVGATKLKDGHEVTVDGGEGVVYDGKATTRLEAAERERTRFLERASGLSTKMKVLVNIAEPEIAELVAHRHVDGIGLCRLEFILVNRIGIHPRWYLDMGNGEQFTQILANEISRFCQAFGPNRRVLVRASDLKTNEYRDLVHGDKFEPHEENPMIGYRGASRYYHEPELFALEARAYAQVAAKHPNFDLMIPFVREPYELEEVKVMLSEHGLVRGAEGGIPGFKLFMMAEVPSNVTQLERFIDVGIDGISIGGNDLTQTMLGVDRDSEMLAGTYNEMSPTLIEAYKKLILTARNHGLEVGFCGQAPSFYPELTKMLVAWGNTSVSVSPDMIEQTRVVVYDAEQELVVGRAH